MQWSIRLTFRYNLTFLLFISMIFLHSSAIHSLRDEQSYIFQTLTLLLLLA